MRRLSDPFYDLFRLLVGTDRGYANGAPWDEAEASREAEIDRRIDTIESSNLGEWNRDLNTIAAHAQMLNGWEFRHFDYFLRSFATRNPSIAKNLLDDALQSNKPLSVFAADFLDGFRDGGATALWDLTVEQIVRKGDPRHVSAIVWSLNLKRSAELEQEIRERDLNLLEDVVKGRNDFTFLSDAAEPNFLLRRASITALVRLFWRDPSRIEQLILKELKDHSALKNWQLSALHLGLLTQWIDFGEFSREGIGFPKNWLIGFNDLDWDAQELLLNMGRNDLQIVLDVFWGRIEETIRRDAPLLGRERYEAVPFNFNPELATFISGHPNLGTEIWGWIEKMTPEPERFRYNWSLNRFLNKIGAVHDIQSKLIEEGDDASLEKALALADPSTGGDPHLLLEIVRRTDNERILDRVGASLYSTDVVWGEYGIAGAYESRREMLSRYLEDRSERVRRFAERMIESFEKSIQEERVRVAERIEIRRIEFEG